ATTGRGPAPPGRAAGGCTCTLVPPPSRVRPPPLLFAPDARDRRGAVAVGAAHGKGADIPQVRLEDEEPGIVGHPHPQDLVVLPIEDLLGDHALLRLVRRLAKLGAKV